MPAWVPKYAAVFEEQIVDNVLTLITRDMKSALDYFYWTGPDRLIEDLPDFAERSLGQEVRDEFPLLVIGPRTNPVEESDDGAQLIEAASIDLLIGVTDDGPATVTRRIMRYVRTLDAVLRSAPKTDYFAGMNSAKVMGLVIEVEHSYGPIGANQSIHFRPATLNLTVKIRETV